jgi:cell wall-associated NlpC family hydrolase
MGLALACVALLAACTSGPESVEKSLEQTTPTRQDVASVALAQVGERYAADMAGPQQFDAAGLTYYAYRQNGRALPRSLDDQLHAGRPVALADAQPGDLVFFRLDSTDGRGQLTVGILIDAQLAVLALPGGAAESSGVQRISLDDSYWSGRLVGVSHILPEAG